jgi:hypothetical protein
MRDNGRIMKETEEESNSGEMDQYTKGIGKTTLPMGMDGLFMQTETSMLGNGLMIEPLEKV